MDQPISVRTNLVSGQGSLRDAAEIVDGRVFLITDPGIVAAGHVARLEDIVEGCATMAKLGGKEGALSLGR